MPRAKKHAKEMQAEKPSDGQGAVDCPEGQVRDAEGNCNSPEGSGNAVKKEAPPMVDPVSVSNEEAVATDDPEDDSEIDESLVKDLGKVFEKLDDIFMDDDAKKSAPEQGDDFTDEPPIMDDTGEIEDDEEEPQGVIDDESYAPNGDSRTSVEATKRYLEKKKLAEMRRALQVNELKIKAWEQKLKVKELTAQSSGDRIRSQVLESHGNSKPRFANSPEKRTAIEQESLYGPMQWFADIAAEKNVMPTHIWHTPKQSIFESYQGRQLRKIDENFNAVGIEFPSEKRIMPATEAISGPPSNDFQRVMSEQVFIDPEGKIVTPFRQFCEVKALDQGVREAFFYKYGAVSFTNISDRDIIPDSDVAVRSVGGATSPEGARVVIKYTDIEESPIELVSANNRSFALESVNAEQKEGIRATYNIDTGSSGDDENRTAKGGGSKTGQWVNGNDGSAITADSTIAAADTLTFKGLMAAKREIRKNGIDISNLIFYTSTKGLEDIIQDPGIDSYLSFNRPEVITEGVIEKVAGVNMVESSAPASLTTGGVATGIRGVLFVPGVAFGLVTGRDLTMEAQRRNETQVIHLTGTHKIAAYTKVVKATCRVSHA